MRWWVKFPPGAGLLFFSFYPSVVSRGPWIERSLVDHLCKAKKCLYFFFSPNSSRVRRHRQRRQSLEENLGRQEHGRRRRQRRHVVGKFDGFVRKVSI